MQFGRLPRKTLLAATLCLAFSAANAAFLEQTGTPAAPPVVMKTYGVDVSTRVGLKAVIPAGWQLFVHRSVELPESLSWKVDESWVSVLNNFSTANDVAVLVDWDKKAVYFRSTEVAMQEQEKRQMIAQAAATPLPSFKAEEAVAPKVEKAVEAVVATASVPVVPVVVPDPKPATVEAVATAIETASSALAAGAASAIAPVASAAVAAVVPKVEDVAVAAIPATPTAPAARVSALDRLLDAATKPVLAVEQAPVAPVQKVAIAPAPVVAPVTSSTPVPVMAAPLPASQPVLVAVAPVATIAPKNSPATTVVVAAAAEVPAAQAATSPVTAAYAEQSLVERPAGEAFNRKAVDEVIRSAAEKNGYMVSWEAADVQFPGPVTILGADMGEDMRLVLRALGGRRSPVSIDVYRASNVVRVRNAAGAAEVTFKDEPFSGNIREKSVSTFTAKVAMDVAPPRVAVGVPAPLPAPVTVAKAPAPVVVAAAPAVAAPVAPAPIPAIIVAEPERLDTAVDNIKKLGPSLTEQQLAAKPSTHAGDMDIPAPVKPVQAAVVLRVEAGESLRPAVEAILEQGWTLKWQVNGDMEANTRLEIGGESIAAILNKVLPRLSLSADIYKPSKLIVIRPADAALDK
jgi:hypothetical protein